MTSYFHAISTGEAVATERMTWKITAETRRAQRNADPAKSYPFSSLQSQRDCVLQPRVARKELPWVGGQSVTNPERVPPMTLNTYLLLGVLGERATGKESVSTRFCALRTLVAAPLLCGLRVSAVVSIPCCSDCSAICKRPG